MVAGDQAVSVPLEDGRRAVGLRAQGDERRTGRGREPALRAGDGAGAGTLAAIIMTVLNGKTLTGRIAADRIRMTSTPKPPKGAVQRFIALGECTSLISDVIDEIGIAEGAIGAHVLKPTLPGKMVVGPALTVRNIRRRDDPREAAKQT